MSKVNYEMKDNKLEFGFDGNEDGENSITLKVNISESIQEAIAKAKKGEESTVVIDAKKVEMKFGVGGLSLSVDTDQDGEKSVELDVSLMEGFEEASEAVKKD